MFVYVVIENGDPYSTVFTSYEKAANAVRNKHRQAIDEDIYWKDESGMHSVNILHADESPTGVTQMYVEKGIHIYIYRLPVV
jgi:hypothetical protein